MIVVFSLFFSLLASNTRRVGGKLLFPVDEISLSMSDLYFALFV